MSKARKTVASRSSMRAEAGRPRLTVRLSSAESAIAPPTASRGRLKPRPQWTTAAVKNCPATAAQRISTSARRRTPPRGGRLGLAAPRSMVPAPDPGAAGDEVVSARATTLFLEHQVLAMHRGEQRDLALRLAIGRLLRQPPDLAQDEAGDGGQRQLARLVELHPADVAELARMADVTRRILGARHEEARIEAARPAGRRHRAGDQVETVEGRREALVQKATPVLAEILVRRPALERLGQHQSGLLESLTHGGNGQRAGTLRRRRLAQALIDEAVKRRGDGHTRIGGIDAAAGKDIAVGHEGVLGVPATQQHFGDLAALAHQDQRRGIARPQIGICLVDLLDRPFAAGLQPWTGGGVVVAFVGAAHDGARRNASLAHGKTIEQIPARTKFDAQKSPARGFSLTP